MSDLINRITAAHQMAIGQMENANRQDEHIRWKTMVRLLEDVRDELNRPTLASKLVAAELERSTLTLKGKVA